MPTLETGQIFERYRILQWLGSGVSGESYEAEDTILLRTLTLKLIHPKSTLPDSARRQFFREMQSISILNHPYLASVLDYGEIDGKLYVARRYVGNGSFLSINSRSWFRSPLNVSDAIHFGHQLAQALQYIHNRGLLHGALTFSNILVLRGPYLEHETGYAPFLLADVGLTNFVRRFGQSESAPLPITAAPEQLGRRVIPASDQFALAVVLYFWLTGSLPYFGSPEEIEHLKLTETITPPSSLNPRVSIEQDGIVLRALSVYPEDRYPSVLAFANALLSTLPPESAPVQKTEPIAETVLKTQPPHELAAQPSPPIEPAVPQSLPEQAVPQPTPDPIPQTASEVPQSFPEENTPVPAPEAPPVEQPPEKHAGIAARLIIISPYTENPYEVLLQNDETTIGRAGSSDILLDYDNLTSRHHALLKRENGRYLIYDRRSANGVQVNGQQLIGDSGFELADGDHISIGNYELIFRFRPPEISGEKDQSLVNHFSSSIWMGV